MVSCLRIGVGSPVQAAHQIKTQTGVATGRGHQNSNGTKVSANRSKCRRGGTMTAGSFLLGLICGAVLMALVLALFEV